MDRLENFINETDKLMTEYVELKNKIEEYEEFISKNKRKIIDMDTILTVNMKSLRVLFKDVEYKQENYDPYSKEYADSDYFNKVKDVYYKELFEKKLQIELDNKKHKEIVSKI